MMGALFYPKEYVKKLSEFCKKNKILFGFDEIQAGFGRTGKIWISTLRCCARHDLLRKRELGEDYLYQH